MFFTVIRRFYLRYFVAALVVSLLFGQAVLAQTWTTDASLKTARWKHTATLLTNGQVLVAGGLIFNDNSNGFFKSTNSAELYNPATGASTLTAPMSISHLDGSATRLTNGQVLVAGGRNNGGSVQVTAEIYYPNSGTWTNTGSLNQQRVSFTAVLLPNGKVLVVGGGDNQAVDQSSAELYDPVSGTWAYTASISYATDSGAAVVLPNGKVLFCGGSDGQGGSHTNAMLYNPASGTWANTGPMHTARAGHAATLLPNGQVLVVGGDNSAEIYNPTNGVWTNAASMNDGRSYPTAALLPNGQVLVAGGDPGQRDTELYNPTNNTWTLAASLHIGRLFNTMTPLGDGQVVVTGGDAGTIGYFNGPAIASVETYAGVAVQLNHTIAAHYPFDAPLSDGPFSSQLLQDVSGNGNDISGPSTTDATYPTVTGTSVAGGSAIQFDGNNYYELPASLLTTIAGSCSISLWLNTTQVSGSDTDDAPSDPGIVWAGGAGNNFFDSEPMTLTGHKLGYYTGDDQATLNSVASIDTGAFVHIVVTRDQPNGVKNIYINGALDSTATDGTNLLSDSTDLLLGMGFYNGGVAGVVDDVQFYNGLLTANDVAFLHANPGAEAPIGLAVPSLAYALNATNLDWTTDGDALWVGQTDVSHDGVAAAQSGVMTNNRASNLGTTVTGPGTLTFWWQTVCAADGFDLSFYIDGTDEADLVNQQPWAQQTYQIGAGQHTLTWTAYSPNVSSPTDFGYVDQVTFSPAPSPGMWTFTGSLTNAPTQQTATLLPNGKVLLAGGFDGNSTVFASAQLYDPATGAWTAAHPLNNARYAHTAILLTNGLVLVTGGASNAFNTGSAMTSAELYNPATGNWAVTGSMHAARLSHTATLLPSGKVLVTGGQSTNAYPSIIASAEVYDPTTGLWATNNSMSIPRYEHTATLLPNGLVLVAGGQSTNSTLVVSSAELYNPTNGTWAATGSMSYPLANHTATLLPNGKVLVAGGDIDIGSLGGFSLVPLNESMLYDPALGTWTTIAQMNVAHDFHTATLLTNGLVLVAGYGQTSGVTNSAELYDPVSGFWTTAVAMKTPRTSHTATLLPNGLVLAAGGQTHSGSTLASAEIYSSIISAGIVLTSPIQLSGGAFQFSFMNTPGAGSTVFMSTNAGKPFNSWTSLGSATEVSPGHFQFTDTQATNRQRFYRVRSP